MPSERPFLTASWTELLMLNFAVPGDVIARLAPPGTEPDFFDGQAYLQRGRLHVSRRAVLWTRLAGAPAVRGSESALLRAARDGRYGATRRGVRARDRAAAARGGDGAVALQRKLRHAADATQRAARGRRARGGRRRRLRMADRPRSETASGIAWPPGRPPTPRCPNRVRSPSSSSSTIGRTSTRATAARPSIAWLIGRGASRRPTTSFGIAIWPRLMSTTPLAEYLAAPPVLAFVADGSPVQVFPRRDDSSEPACRHRRLRRACDGTGSGISDRRLRRRFLPDQLVNERELLHDLVGDHFRHEVLEAHRAVDFVEEHAELLIGLGERFDGERSRVGGEAGQMVVHRGEDFPHVEVEAPGLGEVFPRVGGGVGAHEAALPAGGGAGRVVRLRARRRRAGRGSRRRRRCTASSHLPSTSVIQ